ncbi:HNH endonuclease [Gemmatimonas aurantiaca]|nr:HNH endonuclease [Gemmatimonas aurantiaca]
MTSKTKNKKTASKRASNRDSHSESPRRHPARRSKTVNTTNGHYPSLNGNGSGLNNGHKNGSIVSSRVLLLNQNYEPLSICTAKRAIVMAMSGAVQIVERHETLALRTVTKRYDLPTVVRLDRYINAPRKRVLLNRKNILARDNHRCQYCHSPGPNLTIDHVKARRHGGEDSWENLVTACVKCNSKKGNHTPEQAGMRLHKSPKRPNRISFIRQTANNAHNSWRPYLFMD